MLEVCDCKTKNTWWITVWHTVYDRCYIWICSWKISCFKYKCMHVTSYFVIQSISISIDQSITHSINPSNDQPINQPILYLHKFHNTPLLPPKNLHRHCFRSLLGHVHVPGEIANNQSMQNFGGVEEVHSEIVQVVNQSITFSLCTIYWQAQTTGGKGTEEAAGSGVWRVTPEWPREGVQNFGNSF